METSPAWSRVQIIKTMNEEQPAKPKKSNGQIFKEKNGYSKSLKRALKRNGFTYDQLDSYKAVRKAIKKSVRAIQKKKHETKKALRGSRSKTK